MINDDGGDDGDDDDPAATKSDTTRLRVLKSRNKGKEQAEKWISP